MPEIRSCLSNVSVVYVCRECGFEGIFRAEKCSRCGNVLVVGDCVFNDELEGKELILESGLE